MSNTDPITSFPHAPRKRLKHLIRHPKPKRAMSEKQELRKLSELLKKTEDVGLAIKLTKRMDTIRRALKPVTPKRPVGRPKNVKVVEPEAVVIDPLDAVLELEKQRRETPQPSIVFQHARRAEVKAEIKKEREAAENAPITAPQSGVQEPDGVVLPPKQTGFTVASPGLIDMFRVVSRPRDGEGDEHDGSVGMTNAILRDFEHAPEPQEPVGEGGYFSDGMGHIKRG